MKLIFLYGPPAVGKLTVAEALSQLTGYKVFHNHLTVDLALAFFEFGTPAFGRYVSDLRFEAFERAAQENIEGVIFTFVYAYAHDEGHVRKIKEIVESNDGQVHFVQLTCDRAELTERVQNSSRTKYKKISTVEKLNELLEKYELFKPIPFVESLQLDVTQVSPPAAAQQIVQHYSLTVNAPQN
jgi:shikimate kinase